MSRAYKRHYLEVLYAAIKLAAERCYGERPAAVTFYGYDWNSWYHCAVRMRDGTRREVHFPRVFFECFQETLNLGADRKEIKTIVMSPAEAIRRAYAGLKFPPVKPF